MHIFIGGSQTQGQQIADCKGKISKEKSKVLITAKKGMKIPMSPTA
jgi:hypothetical protein